MYRKKRIAGKYYYLKQGYKTKSAANSDAQKARKSGLSARVLSGTGQFKGYYYVYTTSSVGWRP